MEPGLLPLTNVRQRGYASKLGALPGAGTTLAHVSNPSLDGISALQPSRMDTGPSSSAQQQPADLHSALEEIASIKSQLSSVQTAVSLVKSCVPPASGSLSPSHGRRAKQQPQLPHAPPFDKQSPRVRSSSPQVSLPLHQQKPAVVAGKLVGPKPVSPVPGVASAVTDAVYAGARCNQQTSCSHHTTSAGALASPTAPLHSQQPVALEHSRTAVRDADRPTLNQDSTRSSSSPQLRSMSEADMQAVITDPINHLLRHSFELLGRQQAVATQDSWSPTASAIVPVSRTEAIQLESRLDASLPSGSIIAMQQQHSAVWSKQQQQYWKQQLAVQEDVLQHYKQALQQQQQQQQQQVQDGSCCQMVDAVSQQLIPQHQLMDGLLKELAQQVAYHCLEHGRTVDSLRDRYAELVNGLYSSITVLDSQRQAVAAALSTAVAAACTAQAEACSLKQQVSAQQAAISELQYDVTSWRCKHEQLEQESQENIRKLDQQVTTLRQQVWQLKQEKESEMLQAEQAAAVARDEADAKLAAAEEARIGLLQRVEFLSAQLVARREQQRARVVTEDQEVQTDPPRPPTPPEEPSSAESVAESSSESETSEEDDDDEEPVRKQRRKVVDLLKYVPRGQVRSKLWVVKVIGQIYADKAVADAAADKHGQQISSIAEFVIRWHMNRYGLRHLSTEALSDLLASTCHYAAAGCRPAFWFAHFCGIASAIPSASPPYCPAAEESAALSDTEAGTADVAAVEQQTADKSSTATAATAATMDDQLQIQQNTAAAQLPPQAQLLLPPSSPPAAAKLDFELLMATPAALDFYLFCCCQLAYPNSVLSLFPEAEEAVPLVRSSLVMESLKAIFRYLGDPDGQALFVAKRLDAAVATPTSTSTSKAGQAALSDHQPYSRADNAPVHSTAGANLRSHLAVTSSGSRLSTSSGNMLEPQPSRDLSSLRPYNLRIAAVDGDFGSSSYGRDSGGCSSPGSCGSNAVSIVGGFGYYSAWILLDLFMREWIDRVTRNGLEMAELRRTMAAQQPSLQSQVHAAATAAAHKPSLLTKLKEAKAALDSQLKPAYAAALSALELANRRLRRSSISSGGCEDSLLDVTCSSSASQKRQQALSPHLLVADATGVNAAAAWQAYQALLGQIQLIQERTTRPSSLRSAKQQPSAAADGRETTSSINIPSCTVNGADLAAVAAAELQAAAQQGVVLSDALQQQLRELGLQLDSGATHGTFGDHDNQEVSGLPVVTGGHDGSSNSVCQTTAAADGVATGISVALMQEVLKPDGMKSALQMARAKRAAAAAAASVATAATDASC